MSDGDSVLLDAVRAGAVVISLPTMTSRQRQYAGTTVIRSLRPENARGKMRARGLQHMRKLWSVPPGDFDLWFCGKVESGDV